MAADNSFITNLKENFRRGDIVTRLLYINIGVFLVVTLVNIVLTLFNQPAGFWTNYLEFPACWHTAYIVQYVMAVLVRAFVLAIFFGKTFAWLICIRRNCGRIDVYACI